MRFILPILLPCVIAVAAEEPQDDLLRLTNGELSGDFAGITSDGVIRWERDDGIRPMEFKQDKIRQIVLRNGESFQPGADTSHVSLINGDRVPARIIALDAETLTLDTLMAGEIVVPRDAVPGIQPNPFGGRLLYAGPFSDKGWEIVSPARDEEDKEDPKDRKQPDDKDEEAGEEQDENEEASWRHVGSKWYFTGGTDVLRRDVGLTDQSLLRFKFEWRDRPPIAIAFYADFAGPPEIPDDEEDEEDEEEILPNLQRGSGNNYTGDFGNALILNLRSSYAQLIHCGYNDLGEPFTDQVRASSTNVRMDNTGSAEFEIRSDRVAGTVALFVNGEFSVQWNLKDALGELNTDIPDGPGIGFSTMGHVSPIRISEIVAAEWNGMPDSARSLENAEHDMILLTNGTDRFSGKVQKIEDGQMMIKGRYADLSIPLEEVSEVRFASSGLKEPADSASDSMKVHFKPLGVISGKPGASKNDTIKLHSPLLGDLSIDLSSAVILEFRAGNGFLNYWDEDL